MKARPIAIVIDPERTTMGDGVHLTESVPTTTATAMTLHDPVTWAALVDDLSNRYGWSQGVIVVRTNHGTTDRDQVRNRMADTFAGRLALTGWQTNTTGANSGWFTCRTRTGRVTMLCFLPWVDQGRTALFPVDAPSQEIGEKLARYHHLTGGMWRGTGGLSGSGQVRALFDGKRSQPRWKIYDIPADLHGRSFELLPSHYTRLSDDTTGPFVHKYDTRAMYLAAAAAAELAWDAPEPHGPREFDPGRPGYWRINRVGVSAAATALGGTAPDRVRQLVRVQDTTEYSWVTTPIMQYLTTMLGVPILVHDSWAAHRQSRALRDWAERLRDARAHAGGDAKSSGLGVLTGIKATYSQTIGMLRSPSSRVHRPDWRDTVVDLAKVNLLRKLDTAQVRPLRISTDAVWVDAPDDVWRHFPDYGRIGNLRHEGVMTLDRYRSNFEKGAPVAQP